MRMNKQCILYKASFKPMLQSSSDDDLTDEDALDLLHQIDQLEHQIQTLQTEIVEEREKESATEPQWQLSFTDGQLQLETDITSIEELEPFAYAFSRYLSPFGNTFGQKLVFDQQPYARTVLMTAFTMLKTQCIQNLITSSDSEAFSKRYVKHIRHFHPQHLVRPLMDAYFHCFTDHLPLLHEPSFRVHFNRLENPLQDPVTLAICAAASFFTCSHSPLSPSEKRYVGDYFYERAMQSMLEIYDDHSRAVETLICFNLVQQVMMMTLRLQALKKWSGIVSILVATLENQLGTCCVTGSHKDFQTRVRHAIMHRNIKFAQSNTYFTDFLNGRREKKKLEEPLMLDVLPDESVKVQGMLAAQNHLQHLRQLPLFIHIYSQLHMMHMPLSFTIDFDKIVLYEDMVRCWWHAIPKELKITDELFSLTIETIQTCTDFKKLLIAFYAYDAVLWPSGHFMQAAFDRQTDEMAGFAVQRSAHIFKYLESLTFQLLQQMHTLNSVCFPSVNLLVRSIDQLTKLAQIKEKTLATLCQAILKKHVDQYKAWSSPDHFVPYKQSPFALISNIPPPKLKLSLNELYQDYPLTGKAIMFDVIQTLVCPLIQETSP
ncbi:hypothetical protein A0J61_04117 [Choanephora cucurbitarum]|uniref:Xylanolytic transcriptional activator regulatory domain-containing protein n=1 Tax=Choanephora cucurbitarum TaxID=101091 RepID=A0A1C7NH13_9FUNG|nr:hypothetical protein A0J61_04117 [Choanephora cucurbitarum]